MTAHGKAFTVDVCVRMLENCSTEAVTMAVAVAVAMVNTFEAIYFNYQQHIDVKHQKRVDVQSRQVKVHANQLPAIIFGAINLRVRSFIRDTRCEH